MKPHLMHIAQTLARKQANEEAGNKHTSMDMYTRLVEKARRDGFSTLQIIGELELERDRIMDDEREGDPLFQQGLHNAKVACLSALEVLMSELRAEL